MSDETTHFGYKTVKTEEKAGKVAEVFHSVAASYDLMNDLMSAGIHRLWKRMTIEMSGVRRGHKVLDIAGGTGDLAAKFSRIVGSEGQVILADINESMLKVGRDRLLDLGVVNNIQFAQANAQYLPFPDNTFDVITIAFGLRNVTDKEMALRSMYRVLKPGGKLLVLEFSKPPSTRFQPFTTAILSVFCRNLASCLPKMRAVTNIWLNRFACIPIKRRSWIWLKTQALATATITI